MAHGSREIITPRTHARSSPSATRKEKDETNKLLGETLKNEEEETRRKPEAQPDKKRMKGFKN